MKRSFYRILHPLLMMALLLTFAVPAFAEGGPTPDKAEIFVPSPDASDIIFDSFQVIPNDDGSYAVDVELTVPISELVKPLYFEYSIDFEKKVYSARILDKEKWQELYRESDLEGFIDSQDNEEQADGILEDNAQTGTIRRSGLYNLTIKILTKDPRPFNLTLTTTKNRLKWRVYSDGRVRWLGYTKSCRGHTTPLSHWYVLRCTHRGPLYRDRRTSVSHYVFGKYENYDFWNPRKGTWVEQWITIIGKNNGTAIIRWHHRDWGEFHRFIRGVCIGC